MKYFSKMYIHTTQITVRYGETDQMGVVYYGNYALYYEQGRTEAMKHLGFSYREMEDNGIIMPVIEMNCKYQKSAKYDDVLIIKTLLKELPSRKMTFFSEVYKDDVLINSGQVTLLFFNKKLNKVVSVPENLLELLKPYFI